jgi:DnaK suppressor protein
MTVRSLRIDTPSPLQPFELEVLGRSLAERIATTRARIENLTRTHDDIVSSAALSPPDDEHDPDGATSGFERAQVAALLESARKELAELEHASDRLRDDSFGLCETCGGPIGFARLEARPNVQTCVLCASKARNR